jgi:ribosome maturation factor RimP
MERETWLSYKGKVVEVIKRVSEDKNRFFKGDLIDVLEDKIILHDRKLDKDLPLTLDGLSLVGIENGTDTK